MILVEVLKFIININWCSHMIQNLQMYMLSIYVVAVKYEFKIKHTQNNEYTSLVQFQCAKLSSGILVIQITQVKKHGLQKVDKIKISSDVII